MRSVMPHIVVVRSVLLMLLILLSSHWLLAQRFEQLNDQFPVGYPKVLYEDQEGFLWIGTQQGLVRFDGYSIETFLHNRSDSSSIGGNFVRSIAQDSAGRYWIGFHKHGLDILDKEMKRFRHLCLPDDDGNCIENISVYALCPDSSSVMWVGTSHGLFSFDIGDDPACGLRFVRDDENPSSLSNNLVLKLNLDHKNKLWVGTKRGINLFDRAHQNFINHRTNLTFNAWEIMDIENDREGNLWVSSRHIENFDGPRLLRYDENSGNFMVEERFNSRDYGEFDIAFDVDNNMWLASRRVGAFYIDEMSEEITFYDPTHAESHGFSDYGPNDVIIDRADNTWISGPILHKWSADKKSFHHVEGKNRHVLSVYAFGDQIFYFDDKPRRFNRKTDKSEIILPLVEAYAQTKNHYSNARLVIYGFRIIDDEHILVLSSGRLFIWNTHTSHIETIETTCCGPHRDFEIDIEEETVFIAGDTRYPKKLDLKARKNIHLENLSGMYNNYVIEKDEEGYYWWGGETLLRMSPDQSEIVRFDANEADPRRRLSDSRIIDICTSGDSIWVATSVNVDLILASTLTSRTVFDQDEIPPISSLLVDDQGLLWMGSADGLYRFDPASGDLKKYDQSSGTINQSYWPRSRYKDENGWLYFGGNNGIDYFDPAEIGINEIPPKVYLNKIFVNSVAIDTTLAARHVEHVNLKYDQNYLEIELLALHLTAPEANHYAYRIEELDKDWRYLGTQRQIALANLSPGTYTFHAKAANADDLWSEPKKLLTVHIAPPYWKTWWFITLCILVIAGLLYAAYLFRIRELLRREQIRNRIASDLHDDLGSTLSSIQLLSDMASTEEKASMQKDLLRSLSQYSRETMDKISDIVWTIKPVKDDGLALQERMRQFLFEICGAADVEHQFTEEGLGHSKFSFEHKKALYLIFKEAVNNAIKHAQATRITVSIKNKKNHIELIVKDNGTGFEQKTYNGGNGLGNMKERAETLGGDIEISATVDKGTIVMCNIPL